MIAEFLIAAGIILALNAAALVRMALGPTVFDRLLAAAAVGSYTIVLLLIIGFIFGRPGLFVDLALVYGLLNFMGAVAAGKYLEQHASDEETTA